MGFPGTNIENGPVPATPSDAVGSSKVDTAPEANKPSRKSKRKARKDKRVAVFEDSQSTIAAEPSVSKQPRSRSRRSRVFTIAGSAVEVEKRTMKFEDSDTYETLRHIMRGAGDKEKRRSIKWTSFERMMVSPPLSFKVIPGHGSAVTFVREDQDRGRESVVVHSPHPGSSLEPYVLKNIQRRLRRVMQMEADDFEGPD